MNQRRNEVRRCLVRSLHRKRKRRIRLPIHRRHRYCHRHRPLLFQAVLYHLCCRIALLHDQHRQHARRKKNRVCGVLVLDSKRSCRMHSLQKTKRSKNQHSSMFDVQVQGMQRAKRLIFVNLNENQTLHCTTMSRFTFEGWSHDAIRQEIIRRVEASYDPAFGERVLNIYMLGSRVYGTAKPDSDWDFITITKFNTFKDQDHYLWFIPHFSHISSLLRCADATSREVYDDGDVNTALYDAASFEMLCRGHRLEAFECLCLPESKRIHETQRFSIDVDIDILARVVVWQARHRWSMAKKRFNAEPYKSRKCIFHALRYSVFGLQVRLLEYMSMRWTCC
jgi:hypothetical protein